MADVKSISWAVLPNNAPSFLLDWEITLKCNLDCSYCLEGPNGYHDRKGKHPPVIECLDTLDFMYQYVDRYMMQKKPNQRKVVLNVYGGEALFHPDIIEVLEAAKTKHEHYRDRWHLTITTTTNGIINKRIWQKIIPLIDEFTISYHAETLPKQEKLFYDNLLEAHQSDSRVKCVVMMHDTLWEKSMACVKFCKEHGINYIAKPFDNIDRSYSEEQFQYFKEQWGVELPTNGQTVSICNGRACCGGRTMSLNNDLKSRVNYIPKQNFEGWSCSVNWFFLHVKQSTGEIFFNKDCRMTLENTVGPIGHLRDTAQVLETLDSQLSTKMPTITCAKKLCLCGICAPKAANKDDYKDLLARTLTDVNILEIK